jgi:phage-related protein
MKPLWFLGNSRKAMREFPAEARREAGYQLDRVQRGLEADDVKPISRIGQGVEEMRIWDETGTYRVIFTARLAEAVYVIHAFQKKTQTISQADIDLARERFQQLMRSR